MPELSLIVKIHRLRLALPVFERKSIELSPSIEGLCDALTRTLLHTVDARDNVRVKRTLDV